MVPHRTQVLTDNRFFKKAPMGVVFWLSAADGETLQTLLNDYREGEDLDIAVVRIERDVRWFVEKIVARSSLEILEEDDNGKDAVQEAEVDARPESLTDGIEALGEGHQSGGQS